MVEADSTDLRSNRSSGGMIIMQDERDKIMKEYQKIGNIFKFDAKYKEIIV